MKKKLIPPIVFVCILAVCGTVFYRSPIRTALFKSKDHFIQHAADGRVRYEPGAEALADSVAACLPNAVRTVEREHGLPFKKPFTVFICATQESTNEFIAMPQGGLSRGASILGNVFISPRAFSFGGLDTHRETLTHELSHLHLRQRLGFIATKRRIPVWFHEGLANTVGGSGGERISDDDAREAILEGRHFIPDTKGTFLRMKRAKDYGMRYPMFHKQTKLFVTYMRDRDPAVFQGFLADIQSDGGFASSFADRFGVGIDEMWREFIEHVQSEPGS